VERWSEITCKTPQRIRSFAITFPAHGRLRSRPSRVPRVFPCGRRVQPARNRVVAFPHPVPLTTAEPKPPCPPGQPPPAFCNETLSMVVILVKLVFLRCGNGPPPARENRRFAARVCLQKPFLPAAVRRAKMQISKSCCAALGFCRSVMLRKRRPECFFCGSSDAPEKSFAPGKKIDARPPNKICGRFEFFGPVTRPPPSAVPVGRRPSP